MTPTGYCECGCGEKTGVPAKSDHKDGRTRGVPSRFVPGHNLRTPPCQGPGPNPSGLCMCGCGEPTRIAKSTRLADGAVKGFPVRYKRGHNPGSRHYKDAYTVTMTGCWAWLGSCRSNGTPQIVAGRKYVIAYRWMYEREIGPVPEGHVLHHHCHNRACVNPAHLEPMTESEHRLLHWQLHHDAAPAR